MIVKRVGAALLAVGLIVGAWFVRDRVIDDSDADAAADDNGSADADVVYCISELRETCRALAARYDDLDVRIEPAASTIDRFVGADNADAMWITLEPLADVVATRRSAASTLRPFEHADTRLASSPLSVVVANDSVDGLTSACGDPVDLACLAGQAALAPTFAPITTATGILGVSAAAMSFGGAALDVNSVDFTVWGRRMTSVGTSQLSGGTAVQTIQTRPTFDVAIGAAAELAPAQRDRFAVLSPTNAVQLDVILSVPSGIEAPAGFARAASDQLTSNGWAAARPASEPNGLPAPGVIAAVTAVWEDLT